MRPFYDAIYLSPHLDDAALSCGGQIHRQTAAGKSILIVTVMAGDAPSAEPFSDLVQSLHQRWELASDPVAARRAEDVNACHILGADYLHWDVPDCVYRSHPITGEPLYADAEDAMFRAVHAAEISLIEAVSRRLDELPQHDRIYAPLTVGHHVDHLITRAAAERRFGARLTYYEEFPYTQDAGALEAAFPQGASEWRSEVIPLSENDFQRKIEAIAAFVSQLSTFFDGRADLGRQVREQARLVGGERLWRRAIVQQ